MENKVKHLEFVQGVINRLAGNSFMLKGWAVTLAAGIFALAGNETDKSYFLVAYIPIIVFWWLDAYYLQQERLYRALYNKVTKLEEKDINFSLKATLEDFDDKKNHYFNCFFSKTEAGFYIPLAIVCAGIIIITHI